MAETAETDGAADRMPLNAGDAGYGSVTRGVPGAGGGAARAADASETTPLVMPDVDAQPPQRWQPLSKEELEAAAGGPWWRGLRCYLVALFWLAWVAMLATAVAIIAVSPRPVATPLAWWQRSLFYELQPAARAPAAGSRGMDELCEQLPYLRSLGIGALILRGLLDPSNLTVSGDGLGTLPQIQHLLAESHKADLKVVLDFCKVDLRGAEEKPSNNSATAQHSLWFWLEQGVAGFAICDTDAAYSEKTLLAWRGVFREFSSQEERIVVVKQTQDILPPLSNSTQINTTLVNVVMRSLLPPSHHPLSAREVAVAIETRLQTREEEIWPSWTVGGKASQELKKLLLVLTMTLPGSPALQYDDELDQAKNKEKEKRSAVALFTSLSHSRAREEALLYGSFTFLPYNASTNSSSSSSASNSTLASPSPAILAFLRSWGCVHFLVLLNTGPARHTLDPAWALRLPEAGVFVTSTGMDRLGSTTLHALELRPHEAVVIKLFEAGSYS